MDCYDERDGGKKKIEEEDNANFSHGMGAKEENGRSQREQKAESKAEMFSTWVTGEWNGPL